ncbi:MAG: T9SS type A sorting domain-containing protein [Ignavibacteriae bacterium]|nr:T9SS type A sorting domain-containing protein [Ignavibacteriota bacterium]
MIHNSRFTLAIFIIALSLFASQYSYSQNKSNYNIFNVTDNSVLNSPEMKEYISEATVLSINKDELRNLYQNKSPEISLTLPYSLNGQNGTALLKLKRFDILAPDAKIVARTAEGNVELDRSELDLAVSYTGSVEGISNSLISITFSKDNVSGIMITTSSNFVLGKLKNTDGSYTDNYILYNESNLKKKNPFGCDTEDELSSDKLAAMREQIIKKMNDQSATDLYVADIALEIDLITYNHFGSSIENATNYALSLMASSSAIYMKEVNVRFSIPYVRVWTTTDPYNGSGSNALLTQFRNEWNTNQQAVQRTLAHFITVRSGGLGGIAYVNVLCSSLNSGYGYGFSNTDGAFQPIPTYSWDVMVVSHEIGHNFGSNHTHNCGWVGGPIDSCYTTEGGCYTGPQIPIVGTIMSYCHLNGSISLVQGFGPQPRALIRSNSENAGCMNVSSRPLVLGYPNGGQRFRTGNTTMVYWGSSISPGTVNLELSADGGSTWQTVQNNIQASLNQYQMTIPEIPSTTQAKLRLIDSSNPNIGDTTDASFTIILNISAMPLYSPVAGTRIEVSNSSTQSQDFVFGRGGTDPSITYKVKIKKIGNNPEFSFESNNNGHDSIASVRKDLLDSIANVMGTTGDSVKCTWRVIGYNGIDSIPSANTFLITLVRTNVGISVLSSNVPEEFSLGNNYPNPFNPETTIKFDIAKSTFAELKVFDSRGSEITTFANEKLQPGSYEYKFNAVNLPSGVYFYRLVTNEFSQTKRMILVK